jgi:hypothetical protein
MWQANASTAAVFHLIKELVCRSNAPAVLMPRNGQEHNPLDYLEQCKPREYGQYARSSFNLAGNGFHSCRA